MSATETLDLDHLRSGSARSRRPPTSSPRARCKGMRATLFLDPGEPKPGDAAPLTMHWCLAADVAAVEIGPDGHPARGGFLPPVPLPRRMWAGGKTDFIDALRVGDAVTRRSRIANVELKSGSTGALCFVTVNHTYSTPRGVAIKETQNIVYRDPPPADGKAPPPPPPPRRRSIAKAMTPTPCCCSATRR